MECEGIQENTFVKHTNNKDLLYTCSSCNKQELSPHKHESDSEWEKTQEYCEELIDLSKIEETNKSHKSLKKKTPHKAKRSSRVGNKKCSSPVVGLQRVQSMMLAMQREVMKISKDIGEIKNSNIVVEKTTSAIQHEFHQICQRVEIQETKLLELQNEQTDHKGLIEDLKSALKNTDKANSTRMNDLEETLDTKLKSAKKSVDELLGHREDSDNKMKVLQNRISNELKPSITLLNESKNGMKNDMHIMDSTMKTQGEQIQAIQSQIQEILKPVSLDATKQIKSTEKRTYAEAASPNKSATQKEGRQAEVICFADFLWKHVDKARLLQDKKVIIVPCSTFHLVMEKARPNVNITEVILAVGTNHLRSKDVPQRMEECIWHLNKIFPQATILVCNLIPRLDMSRNYMEQVNNNILSITKKMQSARIIDMWTSFTQEFPGEFLIGDRIHMNKKGTLNIVGTVQRAIQKPHYVKRHEQTYRAPPKDNKDPSFWDQGRGHYNNQPDGRQHPDMQYEAEYHHRESPQFHYNHGPWPRHHMRPTHSCFETCGWPQYRFA